MYEQKSEVVPKTYTKMGKKVPLAGCKSTPYTTVTTTTSGKALSS